MATEGESGEEVYSIVKRGEGKRQQALRKSTACAAWLLLGSSALVIGCCSGCACQVTNCKREGRSFVIGAVAREDSHLYECFLVMASTTKTAKRVSLPVDTKIKILAEIDRNVKSKTQIAKEYNLSSSSLSTIIKNREKIRKMDAACSNSKNRMRSRDAKWPALERALVEWIKKMRSKNIPVDGKLLRSKADDFALQMNIEGFRMSDGWLSRFKDRHGLAFRKLCGESASVDTSACQQWKDGRLKELLEKYSPEDIYNADETGLMFKLLPDRSLVFQAETSAGGKRAKARLTILLAANMAGTDKLPLLVIGKHEKPRCFKGIKTFPVIYKANKKAWMTSEIFESWLRELDRQMLLKNRKILVIVDNCTAHPALSNLRAVELEFLPANMTSVLQPMDQGVIQVFKKNYRRMLLNRIVLCLESGKEYNVTVLSALHLAKAAWDLVSKETVSNCFAHAGFSTATSFSISVTSTEEQALVDALQKNISIPDADALTFEEYVTADNEVQCVEEKTDEAIIKDAASAFENSNRDIEMSSDEEDEEEPKPRPTIREAVEAVQVLRSFFEGREHSEKCLESVMDIENNVLLLGKQKQSFITSYFQGINNK